MSDDFDNALASMRGEGPSPDFVAALRERIAADSNTTQRSSIAAVTELEIEPLRENSMAMTQKFIIGLVAAAIALVAGLAAIGNGSESVSDEVNITDQPAETTSTTAATTTTARVFTDPSAVLDEYIRTYEEGDGSAFFATVASNYRFIGGAQVTAVTGADQIRNVNGLEGLNWVLERIGETTITGDGPFEISFEHRITADNYGPDGRVGTSTFTIVEDGGTLKVSRHVYSGEPL